MVKEVIWTDQSLITYRRVLEYLLEYWSEQEAANFAFAADKIVEHIQVSSANVSQD